MSTRANIVVTDSDTWGNPIWFYRHSDGYPEGAMPTLQKFMEWVREGRIRNNAGQAAGWLVLIGAAEYDTFYTVADGRKKKPTLMQPVSGEWKAGAYEPTRGLHGDIEYLYVVDVEAKTIKCYDSWTEDGEGENLLFTDTADKPWKAPAAVEA